MSVSFLTYSYSRHEKLRDGSLQNIQYRILLAQERLRTQALRRQLGMYQNGAVDEQLVKQIDTALAQDIERLNEFFSAIVTANEPTMLNEDNRIILDRIYEYRFAGQDALGEELEILHADEMELLTISKGSLSPAERKEIESHVVHTQNFLNHIPWTKELRNIPTIAGAHHEKLDGSGYPNGMVDAAIPMPSKIMTICDIYDALTASDRPYKPAMNYEQAIDILVQEAKQGLLEEDLVDVFIDAKVYKVIDGKEYSTSSDFQAFSHHPCDYDLQDHHHDHSHKAD